MGIISESTSVAPSAGDISKLEGSYPGQIGSALPFVPTQATKFLGELIALTYVSGRILDPFVIDYSDRAGRRSKGNPFE